MFRRFSVLSLLTLVAASVALGANPLEQDAGPDGIVSVEAEHYDEIISNLAPHTWLFITETDNGFVPAEGWSGDGAMQSQPTPALGGAGPNNAGFTARSTALNFQVNFVKTGTHYLWVLGYGFDGNSDSCHATLNGEENLVTAHQIAHGWNGNHVWGRNLMGGGVASLDVPHAGLHTVGIWMREDGFTVDKIVLTTNPDYTPTGKGPAESRRGPSFVASGPAPSDGATDVPYYAELTWQAGQSAVKRDVYFGTRFDDVNTAAAAARVSQGQTETSFIPSLTLAETYYWRVDEVNGPPDNTLHAGGVWSFTVEPIAYPVTGVTATASSTFDPNMGPEKTIDASGLSGNDTHSSTMQDMWLTSMTDTTEPWIAYDLGQSFKLDRVHVWNHNSQTEGVLGYGIKEARIETSLDGQTWTVLKTVTLEQARGTSSHRGSAVSLDSVIAQQVRITGLSNFSLLGLKQVGLSEVRFYSIPVRAREPHPANDGTSDGVDVVLQWRAGREATAHEVVFGEDRQAVIENTAVAGTVDDRAFDLGTLDLGTTYFWKINEMNDLGTPAVYAGDLWTFVTPDHIMVDGMESYRAEEGLYIYEHWIDGFDDAANGSIVGNGDEPETTAVYEGRQSLPMMYDNTTAARSEAIRYFDSAQDWTTGDPEFLSLHYRGNPPAYAENADGTLTVSAFGTDIWANGDDFRFVYQRLSGDGSITAKIDSVLEADVWTKAGVMIRENLSPEATNGYSFVTPNGRTGTQWRAGTFDVTTSTRSNPGEFSFPYWVRLTRTGNILKGERSADGVHWEPMIHPDQPEAPSEMEVVMLQDVYIGLAVTSHNAAASTIAVFSDVHTTGTVTGAWATEAIGTEHPSNDAQALYLVVADTAGKEAVFTTEAGASIATDWTAWEVPLTELAGLNLSKIDSVTVGVGDPAGNQPAGAQGTVFFDNIRVVRPYATAP
jgi:hypothetical protein